MLKSDEMGAVEYEYEQNYAVKYAKRNIQAEKEAREIADSLLTDEIDKVNDKVDTLGENKLDKTQYASTEQFGVMKLKENGGIINDGGIMINTSKDSGTAITSVGTLEIVSATETDIDTMHKYKPIVPANFKYAAQKANTYSTTPQQVGTWVDGTPIWRVAIDRLLTEAEKENGQISLINESFTKENVGLTGGFILNSHMISTYDNFNISEGATLSEIEPLRYTGVQQEHDRIIGFIEFVTAKENVNI